MIRRVTTPTAAVSEVSSRQPGTLREKKLLVHKRELIRLEVTQITPAGVPIPSKQAVLNERDKKREGISKPKPGYGSELPDGGRPRD